jgi:hypothetical protein
MTTFLIAVDQALVRVGVRFFCRPPPGASMMT